MFNPNSFNLEPLTPKQQRLMQFIAVDTKSFSQKKLSATGELRCSIAKNRQHSGSGDVQLMAKTAQDYLTEAEATLNQRGQQYDQSQQQERSMAKIVATFNSISGLSLTEYQGWLFMICLKLIRLNTNPDIFHEDSAIDLIAYSALAAECKGKV